MPKGKLAVITGLGKLAKKGYKYAKRGYRRKFGIVRFNRGYNSAYASSTQPVMFTNSIEVSLTGNATGTLGTGFGRTFKFDDISDRADIMNLFDQYQIHSIKVRYIPAWTSAGNSANQNVPFYIVTDPTNGTAPTTALEMLDYARVKKKELFKEFSFTFVPSFMQSVGVTSSNEYCTKPTNTFWLTNTDTLAYGLRIWVDPIGPNSAPIGTLILTYNILARFQS